MATSKKQMIHTSYAKDVRGTVDSSQLEEFLRLGYRVVCAVPIQGISQLGGTFTARIQYILELGE